MANFDQHTNCLVCNSKDISALKDYENTWLQKCANCNFVFTQRIPTLNELVEHYGTYSRNDYLSPITIKRYHEILDFLEPFRKTNKLIDVGCGIGHFLKVAKERGWEVYGTEFTDDAIEICEAKGIKMHKGVLNPENYEPESFDVIVSFEVIEHINNPNEELTSFNKILRKGGATYITTPNFSSISRRYLKGKWSVIEYPEHLSYYTANTLKKVLKQNGFSTKWIQTTGISLTRFQSVQDKSATKTEQVETNSEAAVLISHDTSDEKLRSRMETNPLLKIGQVFYQFFT